MAALESATIETGETQIFARWSGAGPLRAMAGDMVAVTETAWSHADARLALAFWPWSLLSQPFPLPERILEAAADAIVDNALNEWGSPSQVFPPDVRRAYIDALRDQAHAHAICEEYRAGATLDRDHDRADREAGKRIALSGSIGAWPVCDILSLRSFFRYS